MHTAEEQTIYHLDTWHFFSIKQLNQTIALKMKQAKIILMKNSNTKSTIKRPTNVKKEETEAATDYLNRLKGNPLDQNAYQRLMIIYRKAKEFKQELAIIDKAINAFEDSFKGNSRKKNPKVDQLSKKINMAFGLTDKKGKSLFDHEPVATWKKRRTTVLKKIK